MRAASMIDAQLKDPRQALDVLVREAAKGKQHPELWAGLHDAAVRDDLIVEVSAAYTDLFASRQFGQLPAQARAHVYLQAASYFEFTLIDPQGALSYLERAFELAPDAQPAFEALERAFTAAKDEPRLAELYAAAARHRPQRHEQLQLARKANTLVEKLPSSQHERAIRITEHLVAVEPDNAFLRKRLETRYLQARRFTDLCALLEGALAGAKLSEEERVTLHERLVVLYVGDARSPEQALPHVEELMRRDPTSESARKGAEQLLKHPNVADRAAALLRQRRQALSISPLSRGPKSQG
jgi:tetratricopeptide (TPR) repeat protein